jgi:hypothetical protein
MYGPHVAISQFNFTARQRKVAVIFISPSNFLTLSLFCFITPTRKMAQRRRRFFKLGGGRETVLSSEF